MRKDALISVAAGPSQLALFESADALGLAVVAIDRDRRAPGFARCALPVVASTHDPEEAFAALSKALGARPDLRPVAVATKSSGSPVATTAELARRLGLRGLAPARARMLVSKSGQLKAAALAGVRVPRHCAPPSLDELRNTGLEPPLVLKPATTRVGKRGISLVQDSAELAARFEQARAASADGRCQVEVYLPGTDLIVAALFRDSRVSSTVELDEDTRFVRSGSVRGYGLSVPSTLAGTHAVRSAQESVGRFVSALELGTGFGLWTFRVTEEGEPALLEVHLDLAGDFVTELLLPRALGVSPISLSLRNLLGESVDLPAVESAAAVRFLFEDDRAALESSSPQDWSSLGIEGGAPALSKRGMAGERSGYALLVRSDRVALERAVSALDEALGRGA